MRNPNFSGVSAQAKRALGAAAVAGAAGLALSPAVALADDLAIASAVVPDVSDVSGLDVVGQLNKPSSTKYPAALIDTPQTITVIPSAVIEAQNLLTLRDVLSTVPGITFGAGEGGGGYGDSINLRGYSANNDITVDGVRDSAQYTRSDPFNIEQIEVINGASSVYSGAGSVGGTINLVSKTPTGRGNTTASLGIGTDSYYRALVDADMPVSDNVAVRVNLMAHTNDAPGRDVEKFERWGFAPSVAFGLGSPTKVVLSWFHQEDDNVPQYGVPYYRNAFNDGPVPGVDPSNYYGYSNLDTQQVKVDIATGVITHEFNDNLSVRNLSRWQKVTQVSIVDPPQSGVWCLANGANVQTGAACATPGKYTPGGPRGTIRDTENTLLYNQTDFTWSFDTGPLQHRLVAGVAFSSEDFHLDNGNIIRNPNGTAAALPLIDIAHPDHVYTGPINYIPGGGGAPSGTPLSFPSGGQDGERQNQAIYVFDVIELTPQLQLNGGVRFEHNEGENVSTYYTSAGYLPSGSNLPGTVSAGAQGGVFSGLGPMFRSADDIVSYRVGLVYKPVANASLYIAYGNSKTPSQATVNGSGACTLANCSVDPEEAVNYEVGGKWEVLDRRLSLTLAVFRNERSNYKVASNDPAEPNQQLDGQARVDGVALGAAGMITENWAVFANYTWLDSEVIQGVSDFCLAHPAVPACATALAGGGNTPIAGNPLTNVPDQAFSLWTTYDLPHGVQVGYGATYSGKYVLNNAAAPLYEAPSYWVHRLMVSYELTERADLQLNISNVLDEEYYTRIRNNGWATPGDARQAVLTASYRF